MRHLVLVLAFAMVSALPAFGSGEIVHVMLDASCSGGSGIDFQAEWMHDGGELQGLRMQPSGPYPADPGTGYSEALAGAGYAIAGFTLSETAVAFKLSFKQKKVEYREVAGKVDIRYTRQAALSNGAVSVTAAKNAETPFSVTVQGTCNGVANSNIEVKGTIMRETDR